MRRIKIPRGSDEIVTILQHDDGRYPCPVCGDLSPSDEPPWGAGYGCDEQGNRITDIGLGASFDICSCCRTEYGCDDGSQYKTMEESWAELRLKWLDNVDWNPEALAQLKNLEIDTDKLKKENGK